MPNQETVAFFYLVTLQKPARTGGFTMRTLWGTVPWAMGPIPATRAALLDWFMHERAPELGMEGASILHWQCDLDVIPGTTV